jgi:hypothetical protein
LADGKKAKNERGRGFQGINGLEAAPVLEFAAVCGAKKRRGSVWIWFGVTAFSVVELV